MTASFHTGQYAGDGREWDCFVGSQQGATSYHQYRWREVIEKSFGHKGYYLAARGSDGQVAAVLPLVHMKSALFGSFLVSVPFFNYGGVLGDTRAVPSLMAAARALLLQTGCSHLELRHVGTALAGMPTKSHKVTMILELATDAESQWKAFDAKLRNQVRKAEKSGLQVAVGGQDLLEGFYNVFCRNMRDLGTPVYGRDFFENVLRSFPTARIISVNHEGRTIASGIMTRFRDTVEVPWASSIRDFREYCPNNLLYWEAIRLSIAEGARRFDFGRSTRDEGTYRFKKQWGAQPVPLHWQYILKEGEDMPELNPANPKYQLAVKGWRQLPVALTRVIGPRIVRNIP